MFVKTQYETIINLAEFQRVKIEWSEIQPSGNVFHRIYAVSEELYCHRKFRPLSKTRLWYNIHLLKRSIQWRNEYAERFIRTLKEEEVHLNDYENITEARKRIGHFITQVYNQKRPHSALGYLTPTDFWSK